MVLDRIPAAEVVPNRIPTAEVVPDRIPAAEVVPNHIPVVGEVDPGRIVVVGEELDHILRLPVASVAYHIPSLGITEEELDRSQVVDDDRNSVVVEEVLI